MVEVNVITSAGMDSLVVDVVEVNATTVAGTHSLGPEIETWTPHDAGDAGQGGQRY